MFNRNIIFILLLFIVCHPASAFSKTNYQKKLINLVPEEARGNGKLGVYVKSLNTGKVLFEYNPNKNFIPASNNKVISSFAALSLLGKNYRFKTEFYTGGELSKGTLFGGLYIKAYGDPSLTTDDLIGIARELRKKGIKKIKGDIYLDDSYFDNISYGKGWKREWRGDYYCPPIDAFSLNYNTIDVTVTPRKRWESPVVEITPSAYILNISNTAQSSKHKSKLIISQDTSGKELFIKGKINVKSSPQTYTISVMRPVTYFGLVFRNLLVAEGIEFDGQIIRKQTPPWATVFYTHNSKPLHEIINDFNKESVNIIGEALVKTLGAKYVGLPGSWENGSYVMSKYLKDSGIGSNISLADGSGLSRYNRVSPKVLANVLSSAYNKSDFSYEYMSSFPVAGVDGTLKKRFRGSKIKGKVAAKTGYLNGVRALSGYVFARDGNILVFSVISNGLGWKAKTFQNELLLVLVDCCSS